MPSQLGRDFLNRRLAFQPDTENVLSSVNVTIMRRTALAAIPASRSKRAYAFRAAVRNTPAARTRLGSKSFVGFYKRRPVPAGLVAEHRLEHVPACVRNRLSHSRFLELAGVHVADNDKFVFTRNPRGFYMQLMTPRVFDLGVDRADPFLVSPALRNGESIGIAPVVLKRGDCSAIGTGRQRLQPKVNTDPTSASGQSVLNFALERDIPTPTRILDKGAGFERPFDFAGLPEAVTAFQHNERITIQKPGANTATEWNPAQGAPCPETSAEPWATPVLIARLNKLPTNLIDSVRVQAQFAAGPGSKVYKVERRYPAGFSTGAIPCSRNLLRFAAVIPNEIYRTGHPIKVAPCRAVFDPEFVSQKHASFYPKTARNGIDYFEANA